VTLFFYPSSLVFSQTNSSNDLSLNETYESNGIEIGYPFQWEVVEPPEEYSDNLINVVNFRSPFNNNSLNIVIEKLPQEDITVDHYVETGINYLNSSAIKVNSIESNDSILADNPAKNIVFTIVNGSSKYKIMEVVTIKENNAYVITYLASEDRYPVDIQIAMDMIDSFKIESSTNGSSSWWSIIFIVFIIVFFGVVIIFIAYIFKKLAKNISSSIKSRKK
jgi:eukaryotic-like serine/threonine-protein kinase